MFQAPAYVFVPIRFYCEHHLSNAEPHYIVVLTSAYYITETTFSVKYVTAINWKAGMRYGSSQLIEAGSCHTYRLQSQEDRKVVKDHGLFCPRRRSWKIEAIAAMRQPFCLRNMKPAVRHAPSFSSGVMLMVSGTASVLRMAASHHLILDWRLGQISTFVQMMFGNSWNVPGGQLSEATGCILKTVGTTPSERNFAFHL